MQLRRGLPVAAGRGSRPITERHQAQARYQLPNASSPPQATKFNGIVRKPITVKGSLRTPDSLFRPDLGIYFECRSVCPRRQSRPFCRSMFRFQIVSSCARPAGDGWLHEMKGGRMLLAAALVLPCTAIAQAADHRTTELTRACERWDKLLLSICKSGPR